MNNHDNAGNGASSLTQWYEQAVACQLSGEEAEAALLYERVLEAEPAHVMARHNLAMLLLARGEGDAALGMMLDAVESAPRELHLWLSLVEILKAVGQIDYVAAVCEQARVAGLSPDELARLDEITTAVSAESLPELPVPEAAAASQDRSEAPLEQRVVEVVERDRQVPPYHHPKKRRNGPTPAQSSKGMQLFKQAKYRELEAHAQEMARRHEHHPLGWHLLGVAQLLLGENFYGVEAQLKAVYLKPGDAEYVERLGRSLVKLAKLDAAAFCFARSRELAPARLSLLMNYAGCEILRSSFQKADELTAQLCREHPQLAKAHYLRGFYLTQVKEIEASREAYRKTIELDPGFAAAYQDLGLSYFNAGHLDDALQLSREAIEKLPGNAACFSNLLFFALHDETIDPQQLFEMHKEYGERYEAPLLASQRPHDNDLTPGRKLRVGFVSADFNRHAVANFFMPVLEYIDKSQIDLFGFCNSAINDEMTERLKGEFKYWLPISHVSDSGLADVVRACKIDILIDLSGHTAGNRLPVFARKPAPIQISWIGYPGTTGLSSMDYAFADRFNAPPGLYDHFYVESIWRLPSVGGFMPPKMAIEEGDLPALRNGYLTFGSFNRFGKITASTLKAWAGILTTLPSSRMIIGAVPSDEAGEEILAKLESLGVARHRITIHLYVETEAYLKLHQKIDLILDTFPYHGATTSSFAAWMGVPVLTRRGSGRMSNSGAGIMARYGCDQFIAKDYDDLLEIVKSLESDLDALSRVRSSLRQSVENSPHTNSARLGKDLSKALRDMWLNYVSEMKGRIAQDQMAPEVKEGLSSDAP